MTDEQIIEFLFRRDERALSEIESKYKSLLRYIAENFLSAREDVEECLNDVLLSVWNAIPPAHPASLRSFVSSITRNLALNRYKEQNRDKRGGGQVPLALEELSEVVSDTEDIPADYARQELLKSISVFLRGCSARDRGIFLDRYVRLESTEALSARYRIKEAQVLLILSRTRKKLKAHLEKEGYTL